MDPLTGCKRRVVVADDFRQIHSTIAEILTPGFEMVGYAENGEQAVAAVTTLNPDVLIIDLQMPVMDGITAVRSLWQRGFRMKVVFISTAPPPDLLMLEVPSNAFAFVSKADMFTQLVPVINRLLTR